MYYLYTLNDENNIPRYIGITNNPKRRSQDHLKDKSITPKTLWIKSMREGGKLPKMVIRKQTESLEEIINLEIKAIAKYKDVFNLTNSTEGGEYPDRCTPINVYNMEGEYLDSYTSMIEFCELNGWPKTWATCISSVCMRKRHYHKNFIFRYTNDTVTSDDIKELKETLHNRDPKHFYILNLDGEILGEFNSLQEAEKANFGQQEIISKVLKREKGFYSVKNNLVCYEVDEYEDRLKDYQMSKNKHALKDCISKYTLKGEYLGTFYSCHEACLSVKNATNTSIIKMCCDGKYKQAYGFQWKYGNSKTIPALKIKLNRKANSPIDQYSLNGEFIRSWKSRREAADTLNISFQAIARCLSGDSKSSAGYIWKYKEAVP